MVCPASETWSYLAIDFTSLPGRFLSRQEFHS